jgi:hypothetical protein
MKEVPNHFLQEENLKLDKNDIKKLVNISHKITFELAKNTKEIAFFIIPEKHISEYS